MNNRWIDDAVHDNAMVTQILLQLQQEVSQLPMPQLPPPPQAPEMDKPGLFVDWGVRQHRSRRTAVRRVAARSEVVGASTIRAISGSRVKDSGRRGLNRSNASKSKAILQEPSGKRTPTKRPGKLKKLVKLGDKEAMLEEKKLRKRENDITKTAIEGINDKESLTSNVEPQSQGERGNNDSVFVCG